MSLVPAVTELMLAELLYLQYDNPNRPIFMYINSTGVAVSGRDSFLHCRSTGTRQKCSEGAKERALRASCTPASAGLSPSSCCAPLHLRQRPGAGPYCSQKAAWRAAMGATGAEPLSAEGRARGEPPSAERSPPAPGRRHASFPRPQKGSGKLGYESEAFAIYDTMRFVKPEVGGQPFASFFFFLCKSLGLVCFSVTGVAGCCPSGAAPGRRLASYTGTACRACGRRKLSDVASSCGLGLCDGRESGCRKPAA